MRAAAYPREDAEALKPADDAGLLEAFVELAEAAWRKNGELVRL